MTYDVAVVGAGIVGAACAREAAKAGLRVIVVDHAFPASGATGAGMGHLVAMDDSEAQFALTRHGCDLWAALAPDLPPDCEYTACGTVWVAADEEEMAEVFRKRGFYAARGIVTDVLDSAQLRELEPNLRAGLAGALLVRGDAVLYPPCATRFLLQHPNITVTTGRAISLTDGSVTLADGTTLSVGIAINAAGVHAGQLNPQIPIAIQPRKGHLVITDRYPGFVRHQIVELGYLKSAHATTADSVAFNIQPRPSGQVLIGSSRQFGASADTGQDAQLDRPILSAMLARAAAYMPELLNLSAIRAWAGFRASTADKLPLIGRIPGLRKGYVAAGHEGLGITTSLATGRLLADLILGRPTAISAEPYAAERPSLAHA